MFILRDLPRPLQTQFSDSRLGREGVHWFVFTLLAIMVPYTSCISSNLLRSLQALIGLYLYRRRFGQGYSRALARHTQSPAKSFRPTPFTRGGMNFGTSEE